MTKTTNLLAISAVTVAFAMLTTSALADAAIFVKIPNMGDNSILTEGYNDGTWFEADSFKCGTDRELKKKFEKGGTEDINIGLGELQECTISKSLNSASAQLAQFAINGNSPGTAEIDFVEIGGSGAEEIPVTYLKYKLDRVFIKSWSTSGDADVMPVEEVAFYYNKIAFAYTPQGESTPEPNNIMSWDNVKNIPWDGVFDPMMELLFPSGKLK
jgi:type VI protein secretion system component Hcp